MGDRKYSWGLVAFLAQPERLKEIGKENKRVLLEQLRYATLPAKKIKQLTKLLEALPVYNDTKGYTAYMEFEEEWTPEDEDDTPDSYDWHFQHGKTFTEDEFVTTLSLLSNPEGWCISDSNYRMVVSQAAGFLSEHPNYEYTSYDGSKQTMQWIELARLKEISEWMEAGRGRQQFAAMRMYTSYMTDRYPRPTESYENIQEV